VTHDVSVQQSLFAQPRPESSYDPTFSAVARVALDESSWIDLVPGWAAGADRLFDELVRSRDWSQRSRWMYDRRVLEPRLTARWELASGLPLEPPVLDGMRQALSARYGVLFDSAGFNLYRDGRDGVAWHRDKIRREIPDPVVPLLSLGEPRKLLFRPRGGGRSHAFLLRHGDLLVTGGTTQRTWEHAVLKVARAGARISVAFRYGLDPRAYAARGAPTPT
jgi:alkylated DNA repair dioxygenase AlkB